MDDDRFYVKSLTLENFRCFEKTELGPFDRHFNLLVGANGTGKSSVLLALASLFRQLGAPNSDDPSDPLTTDPGDIMYVNRVGNDGLSYQHSPISGRLSAYATYFKWEAFASEPIGNRPTGDDQISREVIRILSSPPRPLRPLLAPTGHLASLPLIAYYTVARPFRGESPGRSDATTILRSRLSGLARWRAAGTQSEVLKAWFKDQTLADLQRQIKAENQPSLFPVQELTQLQLVREAVIETLEGVSSIDFESAREDIVVQFSDGTRRDFSGMSDGQRSLIGLVSDIARRAFLLNAPVLGRSALTETPGLILIDEIDLHLHPKWQRQIVGALKRIFPKIQFFATTHSPQVIGEARPEEIVLLTKDGQQKRPPASYGMDSNWILECVMEAEGRDPTIAKDIKRLYDAIEDGEFEVARKLIKELRRTVGNFGDVEAAESYMWRAEHEGDEAAE